MLRFGLVLVQCFVVISCQGTYRVIGPRTIRPNSEYHAAVSIESVSAPTIVSASIQGLSYDGRPFSVDDSISVPPYSTRVVHLQVGNIQPGDYRLVVQGRGGADFQTTSPLDYVKKSYSVFVQTDKAVYRPGSKIMFRAIVLNPQLKPTADVRDKPLDIRILDGNGNIIKEWSSVEASRGVYTNELQLSEHPVLGTWNINVLVNGQSFNKTIDVANYVFPKFLITIQAPKHVTFTENIITANIQATYFYGEKVKGIATVTAYPTINSGVIQPIFQNPVRKVLPIDGSATVDFDIDKDLQLSDEYERIVVIDVTVEEELTGRRQNNSVEVHIHKYDYKMELVKTADYYKPGLPYTAFVKVSNHDGTPIQTNRRDVLVRHGFSRVDEIYVEERHSLDKNGIIILKIDTPRNSTNETALRIEAEYFELKERMPPVPAAVSYSNTFLQASLETEKPLVNLEVEILVNCTEPLRYISYELLGRGDVLIANTLQVDNKHEYRFHFIATQAMAPLAHLIVSYTKEDGELIADSLDIEVDGLLQNFIDVQLNTFETRPESDVEISVRTQPNSYVGLLAVDQYASHLKTGYDVAQQLVVDELLEYDIAQESPYFAVMRDAKSHFFWKPGSSNSHDVFYDSGALLLTNSFTNKYRPTLEDIYLRPPSYKSSTVKPDRGIGIAFQPVTRPPLAGPYAFSRIPKPVWNKPKIYLTQEIADTWLFTNFSSGYEGKTSIRRRLPSTLNTWVITGFSLDPLHGLGLTTNTKKLKVSKPFVVSCDLPHSVKHGEVLSVAIVVYNYLDKDITADVTLHNEEHMFKFAEVGEKPDDRKKVELYRKKKVSVRKNSGSAVSFMLEPLRQGQVDVKISASSSAGSDTIVKRLNVIAKGETLYFTKTVLIDLRKSQSYKGNISFDIPKNVIPETEKIEASLIGDILGPTMVNLENLIRLPTGCGEQNLVRFMPNLIILNYLRSTGQTTPPVENEAVSLLEKSYQTELSYQRKDGSFSMFGDRDDISSTWLTAYVALALSQARSYIYIDEKVIMKTMEWLLEHQNLNGSFVEGGNIVHEELQNRNGNSLAMTAFALIPFIENKDNPKYNNAVNKGLDYIARNLDENEDIYTIAICSYVLQLTNHPSRQIAFNLLDTKAKTGNNTKWWGRDIPANETQNPWNQLPKSMDIETTAYALLTFLEANLLEDAVPVVNWLVSQQNSLGGFTSSHDTVVGLYALYKLVTKLSARPSMQVEFAYREKEVNRLSVNPSTAMIVQKTQLSKTARNINITASGSGFALFRVSYQYNVDVTGPWPMFTLDPQVDKNSNIYHLQVSICTAFVSRNLSMSEESNMAVMEVNFPSGFTADIDTLPSLEVSENVQKVETRNNDATVLLYFNNLTTIEYCPTVSAFRTHKVAEQKPVPVVIYDYYDSSRRARVFYNGITATKCNICEREDCEDRCAPETNPQRSELGESKGKASNLRTASILSIFIVVLATIIYS